MSELESEKGGIVFFDGICGLCNGLVDWLLGLGRATETFRFATLQGRTAGERLPANCRRDLNSLVFLNGDRTFTKSTAILMIASKFRGWDTLPVRWMARLLLLLPVRLRDLFYDWVAYRRYQFFGKRSSCRRPTSAERERFLD